MLNDDAAEIYPVRYHADEHGGRLIFGLNGEETAELERLQASGEHADVHIADRWRALYARHERAWQAWLRDTRLVSAAD